MHAAPDRTPAWAVLAAGILFCWPAFWNGYPLVFADTGTYLGQALLVYLGWDRPAFYSVFLHGLHWRLSLWPPVLAQGVIAAHLLALSLRVLDRPGPAPLLACAVALAVLTGLPWFASQLMPDIFTGLTVLVLWLLAFGRDRLGRLELAWLLLLATIGIAVHLTHLPLALGLAVVAGGLAWARQGARVAAGVVARLVLPALVAAVATVGLNAAAHGRAALSPFGSVFLAARLIEDGPALRVIEAQCPQSGWRICTVRDRLPEPANIFLWEPDRPLWAVLGGAKAWAPEAGEIVAAAIAQHPSEVLAAGLGNAASQFTLLGTGDGLQPWRGVPGPEPLVARFFPRELVAFRESRQYEGSLAEDARRIAPLHVVLAWIGLLMLPAVALRRFAHPPAMALCVMVLAAAVGNALLTGALSGPNERYQARLAWLCAFAPAAAFAVARAPRGAAAGATARA
jgi:hypothetical protein